jgi:hypothetical protein
MRKFLLVITTVVLTGATAQAEPPGKPKPDKPASSGKVLPLKRATSGNSCAGYGAGFVKIEGTETCMKIGGAIGIGAGTSAGSR